jgi:hypothetical protein
MLFPTRMTAKKRCLCMVVLPALNAINFVAAELQPSQLEIADALTSNASVQNLMLNSWMNFESSPRLWIVTILRTLDSNSRHPYISLVIGPCRTVAK